MIQRWFSIHDIPYDQMWQDCRHWLPPLLDGRKLQASFTFDTDLETVTTVKMGDLLE